MPRVKIKSYQSWLQQSTARSVLLNLIHWSNKHEPTPTRTNTNTEHRNKHEHRKQKQERKHRTWEAEGKTLQGSDSITLKRNKSGAITFFLFPMPPSTFLLYFWLQLAAAEVRQSASSLMPCACERERDSSSAREREYECERERERVRVREREWERERFPLARVVLSVFLNLQTGFFFMCL